MQTPKEIVNCAPCRGDGSGVSWTTEGMHDGTVDVVTRGRGISNGGATRNLWLEHWPRSPKRELEYPVKI